MPLKFDTLEQELNLMALIAFLSFGSGYREELRTELDRDHADTVRFGIMSMHISSVEINATFLSALTLAEVSAFFDIPITKEVAHATLPMTMTEPHPLRQLVQMLTDVLNEIGKALKVKGFRNLGHFLLDATNSGPTTGPTVERLLDAVLNTFPSARDMDRWGGIGKL
ncbi:hypothetical protein DFJ77DRAFT_468958 [Powellomyces hirtus]|nr:hypothetical protein DFJ77DRAFT_468958 [Powellomyces hirtus]